MLCLWQYLLCSLVVGFGLRVWFGLFNSVGHAILCLGCGDFVFCLICRACFVCLLFGFYLVAVTFACCVVV